MVKFILLIPLNYNDGLEVPEEIFEGMLDEIFSLAEGFTVLPKVRGAYLMADGSKQVDWSSPIWITLEESMIDALKELVGSFAERLGQESMYLERTESTVEFIYPLTDED